MKNIITAAAAVTTAVCCTVFSVPVQALQFPDIEGHWAKEYIQALVERNTIEGMDDGLFHPEKYVTNAQFVTMLIKSRYGEIAQDEGSWYSGYMDFALQNGIISDLEMEFPDNAITRQSAARIIHELLLKAYNEPDEDNWQDAEVLPDLYSCHTCVMHIAQVYVKGIMTGRDDGAFHLTDTLTRAEAAAVVMRVIEPSLRVKPDGTDVVSNTISIKKAMELVNDGAILIDVRNSDDYSLGHIKGSISVPINYIESDTAAAMSGISSDSTVIVYCRMGTNSRRAASILKNAGYNNVYDLGGIENGDYELVTE